MSDRIVSAALLVWLLAGFLYVNTDFNTVVKAPAPIIHETILDTIDRSLIRQVAANRSLVDRGKYLVTIMGCNDCHSPKKFGPQGPEPDPERLLSGHPSDLALLKVDTTRIGPWVWFNSQSTAYVGPWGASFAANLTPDATGTGNWSEEQFRKAMREGKYKGLDNSRNLLPPMPWPSYAQLTDADLKAIFAYLRTVKPIRNIPPSPKPLKDLQ
jgi:hypothetical protein